MDQTGFIKSGLRMASRCFILLAVAVLVTSCSKKHPYDEAVDLIKQKKYDEAKQVLNTIAIGDSLASKVTIASMTCDIGILYQKKEYELAFRLIDSTVLKAGKRVYLLNPAPTDALYSNISTLCVLVSSNRYLPSINSFLTEPVDYSVEGLYDETDPAMIGILYTNDMIKYRPEDVLDIYEAEDEIEMDTPPNPPFIRSVSLDKLTIPKEWEEDAGAMKKTLATLLPKIQERRMQILQLQRAEDESVQRAASDAAVVSAMTFKDKWDAITWLLGTDGQSRVGMSGWEKVESESSGLTIVFVFRGQGEDGYIFYWRVFLKQPDGQLRNFLPSTRYRVVSVDMNKMYLIDDDGDQTSFERIDKSKMKFEGKEYQRTR